METRNASNIRYYELDWLRVLAFGLLIFYHTGMIFVSWGFHIMNKEHSELLEYIMLVVNQWRLPLLFLVSGAGVRLALRKRSAGSFAKERFRRLFIPILVGMFIVVPPQSYYEALFKGVSFTSYADFYTNYYLFEHLTWNHLWFVVYLFVYSLICLPLFGYLLKPGGQRLVDGFYRFMEKPGMIFLLALPLFISEASLRPFWESTHNLLFDWANFVLYLLLFTYGFVLAEERFLLILEKNRKIASVAAVSLYVFLLTYYWIGWTEDISIEKYTIYRIFKMANVWVWIVALTGHARKYLRFENGFLRYANEAVYPFFILHQTVTIAIGFYIIQWDWSIAAKFWLTSAGTFFISWLIYEAVIKRVNLMRFLFGQKPLQKTVKTGEAIPVYDTTGARQTVES